MGKNKGQNNTDMRGMPSDPMEATNMQPQNKSGSKKGSTNGKSSGKPSGGAKG